MKAELKQLELVFMTQVWCTFEQDWPSYLSHFYGVLLSYFLLIYYKLKKKGLLDMNGVFIIPTGIGCEVGGHAGDATPSAKLIASLCDKLIIHPNVVNASDINELTPNMLYVEGSTLDRFLEGSIELRQVKSNKILLVTNSPIHNETLNAVEAARVTLGISVEVKELRTPLIMNGYLENNIATGDYQGVTELIEQVKHYNFDALAIASGIKVGEGVQIKYFKEGGTNPWGGIEAKVSRLISEALDKPVAHAPVSGIQEMEEENVAFLPYEMHGDPRMAPEIISNCFVICILKGLHKAPRIGRGLNVGNIDFLVSPINCCGHPHRACLQANIPVIAVKENICVLNDSMPDDFIIVENYLEAAGVVTAIKEGISLDTVRRPIFKIPLDFV